MASQSADKRMHIHCPGLGWYGFSIAIRLVPGVSEHAPAREKYGKICFRFPSLGIKID
jgi:hypothetical protein